MTCPGCNGRGWYLDNEIIDGCRHTILCGCTPSNEHKDKYETLRRIQKRYEKYEEENNND